jgi:hypothetical protein
MFNRRLAHTFGIRASNDCELKGAVLALPDLAGGSGIAGFCPSGIPPAGTS